MFVGTGGGNVCWLNVINADSYDDGNADWYGGSMVYCYDEYNVSWYTSVASDDTNGSEGA